MPRASPDEQYNAIGLLVAASSPAIRRSFMHYDPGYIDLEQKTLQSLDNPFGPRLLPMS